MNQSTEIPIRTIARQEFELAKALRGCVRDLRIAVEYHGKMGNPAALLESADHADKLLAAHSDDASQLPPDGFIKEVRAARQVWLDENDPKDGSDCVTPFDQFLYGASSQRPVQGAATLFEIVAAEAERRYPSSQVVDDEAGETGKARTDDYGYQEFARRAFVAGADWALVFRCLQVVTGDVLHESPDCAGHAYPLSNVTRNRIDRGMERFSSMSIVPPAKLPLRIVRRPMLVSGQFATGANGSECVILIDSEQSEHQQTVALWHELLHLVRTAEGLPQDEAEIESQANVIANALGRVSVTLEDAETFLAKYHREVWEAASNEDGRMAYDEAGEKLAEAFLARFGKPS